MMQKQVKVGESHSDCFPPSINKEGGGGEAGEVGGVGGGTKEWG